MTNEERQTLEKLWMEFRHQYPRVEQEHHWREFLLKPAPAHDSPVNDVNLETRGELIHESFLTFEIEEVRREEIQLRARDAVMNMCLRRLVEGVF
jgi:hypothetical protein